MPNSKPLAAEFLGTFWLVFGGCGAAVLAAKFPSTPFVGIGFGGVALAFGLTLLTMAFAVGHISGAHFNPAVTAGAWAAGRLKAADVIPYWIAQILGAIAAAAVLYLIASGREGFSLADGFAANGYGDLSPGKYSVVACFVAEVVATFFFLLVILGSTHRLVPAGFAPIPMGLALTLANLIIIPVTNASVNPARSIGPALFAGGPYIAQLWLFIIAPLIGAVLAGLAARALLPEEH
jgi:aquaporin Z